MKIYGFFHSGLNEYPRKWHTSREKLIKWLEEYYYDFILTIVDNEIRNQYDSYLGAIIEADCEQD